MLGRGTYVEAQMASPRVRVPNLDMVKDLALGKLQGAIYTMNGVDVLDDELFVVVKVEFGIERLLK